MKKKFPVEVAYSTPDVKVISFHSHGFSCFPQWDTHFSSWQR